MSHATFLLIVCLALAFGLIALGIGSLVLRWIERLVPFLGDPVTEERLAPSVTRLGASLLTGYGVLAYVGVVLGLAHVFYESTVIVALLACALLGRRGIVTWLRAIAAAARALKDGPKDWLTAAASAAIAVLVVVFVLASVAPPVARDALSYHLPQAHEIVDGHVLWLNLGGHPFYGSIPKIIEVLFAEAITIHGDALAQMLHLSIALSFMVFVWGTIERFFDRRRAAITVLALLCYHDLFVNATSALIDGAVVSFEIAGVIAAAAWVAERRSEDAARAALFLGLSAAAKYSALFSIIVIAAIAFVEMRRDSWTWKQIRKAAVALGAIAFAAGGYWYVKNTVKYGNPTYPFYFGHEGVTDAKYEAIQADVQQFGPRTLTAFIKIPTRFEQAANFVPFLSFFLAPFALLVKRSRKFTVVLAIYAALYLPYWFFIATHQVRFLMPAICALVILAAGTLSAVLERVRSPRTTLAFAAGAAVVLLALVAVRGGLGGVGGALSQAEIAKYGLGLETKDEFLTDQFGCQYRVVSYLNRQPGKGAVLDNWSQWHDPTVKYFSRRQFVSLLSPPSPASYRGFLESQGVRFYYVKTSTRRAWNGATAQDERTWFRERVALDRAAAKNSKPIYSYDDCHLARIS